MGTLDSQIRVGEVAIGGGRPLVLIAGMCVIESEDALLNVGHRLCEICERLGIPLVLKSSFDKANRTSVDAFRGPGLDEGLAILDRVRARLGVPVTTDVHLPSQAAAVAEVAELLQVPAFLCRQTDLLEACAKTGRPVNVKKGQFQAPWDMGAVVEKLRANDCHSILLTERGTTFGYNELIVDFRSLPELARHGTPVCFDATHAVQKPGGNKTHTGGDRDLAPVLAKAAVAIGVDAIFMEVHETPELALSDGANSLRLSEVEALLSQLVALDALVKRG
ncbi:MAG: 3-deoxy-8-phosphooctulonate synthase [Myxococcota bacterium]|nr:3-deoxy-8-phosphooctulonate synthase [Myxococcota bacterium]